MANKKAEAAAFDWEMRRIGNAYVGIARIDGGYHLFEGERQPCCEGIKGLLQHLKTVRHVARVHGVDENELREVKYAGREDPGERLLKIIFGRNGEKEWEAEIVTVPGRRRPFYAVYTMGGYRTVAAPKGGYKVGDKVILHDVKSGAFTYKRIKEEAREQEA
jgi:hypothetical protein